MDKALGCIGALAVAAALNMAGSALLSWLVMLLLGVVHHEFAVSVPAPGFWPIFAVTVLSVTIFRMIFPSRQR